MDTCMQDFQCIFIPFSPLWEVSRFSQWSLAFQSLRWKSSLKIPKLDMRVKLNKFKKSAWAESQAMQNAHLWTPRSQHSQSFLHGNIWQENQGLTNSVIFMSLCFSITTTSLSKRWSCLHPAKAILKWLSCSFFESHAHQCWCSRIKTTNGANGMHCCHVETDGTEGAQASAEECRTGWA